MKTKSVIEEMLLDALASGQKFASANDFYGKRVAGNSFVVMDEGPEADAFRARMRDADLAEVERLQDKYSNQFSL